MVIEIIVIQGLNLSNIFSFVKVVGVVNVVSLIQATPLFIITVVRASLFNQDSRLAFARLFLAYAHQACGL